MEVPPTRTLVDWGLYWGSHFKEKLLPLKAQKILRSGCTLGSSASFEGLEFCVSEWKKGRLK